MAPVLSKEDYQIGIICALAKERAAVENMLEEEHDPLSIHSDDNIYTFGKMGKHNVVIASLPAGNYGNVSAAIAAVNLTRSFPHLRFGLMVGIAGAMPRPDSEDGDIRLGDIVVGCANNQPSVINYRFGKHTKDGFELTGVLPPPPTILLNAIAALEPQHSRKGPTYLQYLSEMFKNHPRTNRPRQKKDYYNKPAVEDKLFRTPDENGGTVDRIPRDLRDPPSGLETEAFIHKQKVEDDVYLDYPHVHYGTIASADQLMKTAVERNKVFDMVYEQKKTKILCFEMEASGIVSGWPCLIIRGICDYCDEHKNDEWQNFASATAAAYAKDILSKIEPTKVNAEKKVEEVVPNMINNNQSYQITNSGSGPTNINSGSGTQRNYSQSGSNNRMFNGEVMTFNGSS